MAALAMLPVIHWQRWETLGKRERRIRRSMVMERVMPTKAPRHSLGSPQSHNCVAVRGVRWRFTVVCDLRRVPREYGPWRSMAVNRNIPDGSENHGVPGSNPGPAT